MNILYYAIVSTFVSVFISVMMGAKIKVATFGSVMGGVCYVIFILCGSSKIGYFIAALVLALLSELMAKLIKTPSTLFLIIGIYPLVPGSGIYKTIMKIIEADYAQSLVIGGDTFVNIALMATAIALVSIILGKTTEDTFKRRSSLQLDLIGKRNSITNIKK